MSKIALCVGILSSFTALAYLGCKGESDEGIIEPGLDSGEKAEASNLDVPDAGDAASDVVLDTAVEVGKTDDANDAEADAQLYSCVIMNADSGATFGDAGCNTCMSDNCCDDITACFSYDDCVARVQCVRDCDGGAACKNACKTSHPDSGTLAAAVSLCLSGSCSTDDCPAFP